MMKYNATGVKSRLFLELTDRIDRHYDSIESLYKEGAADES
jgi:hypothetical protein